MKAFFLSYNQALTDRINRMLDEHGVRGFTRWALTEGRGSYDGEPAVKPVRITPVEK